MIGNGKKESRDIIYINEKYRSFIEELNAHDVLGFKLLDNKESFMLAVALGVNNPTDCQRKDLDGQENHT